MEKYLLVFIMITLFACNNGTPEKPSTAMDAGRTFIRATLDGNFKDAEALLLKDSINVQLFESYKKYYSNLATDVKQGYKKAAYIINNFDDAKNDSTAIINYSNDYMHKPMNIKVTKKQNQWYIDFKYTASDTTNAK